MTKEQVVLRMSAKTGMTVPECLSSLEAFVNVTKEAVKKGHDVTIRGFGTIKMRTYAEKKAQNISKGETITVPECQKPYIKFSKNF